MSGTYEPVPLWLASEADGECFAAFRAEIDLVTEQVCELVSSASGPYRIFVDERLVEEGPVRARAGISALARRTIRLSPGTHVVAVLVHHEGVATRILEKMPAHLRCAIEVHAADAAKAVHLDWRVKSLTAYRIGVRRINPELGWIDWCDTRSLPAGWSGPGFDADTWDRPRRVPLDSWHTIDAGIGPVSTIVLEPKVIAAGYLSERYGYETDDPPARFFLRALTRERVAGERDRDPSQGVWVRCDAERIGLYSPVLHVDVPEGTVVEIAYCEELIERRVSPFVTLSLGPTCNLDHFVARGGSQQIEVSGYRGGRYLEVHLLYPDGFPLPPDTRGIDDLVRMELRRRTYYPEPSGRLETGEALLDRIWRAGADTLAACSEDAVDDCPTRERGQWLGDVVTVGAAIASAAFADLRPFRKALLDAALSARSDGMVAGLCPGTVEHIPSYAATWTEGVLAYLDATGDWSVMDLLYASMVRNVDALLAYLHEDGVYDGPRNEFPLGWVFVDWGYVANKGPSDMVFTMHLLNAVRSGLRWHALLDSRRARSPHRPATDGSPDDGELCRLLPQQTLSPTVVERFGRAERKITRILHAYLDDCFADGLDWERLGYHRAVLAIRHALLNEAEREQALAAIRAHQDACFPNDLSAPRNDAPFKQEPRLITPYFYNYAMPLFAESGDFNYVLDQYRSCWGWLLEGGYTTLCEVFDRRWSQCHQWSGSPTWQLTRYVLGLAPEYSWGERVYRCTGVAHPLAACGEIPIPRTEHTIHVESRTIKRGLELRITTPVAITLLPRTAPRADQASERSKWPVGSLAVGPGRSTIVVNLAGGSLSRETENR